MTPPVHLEGAACSPQQISNLYTMACTAKVDPKQEIPNEMYVAPSFEVRELRARLAVEEMLEKCAGLGFGVVVLDFKPVPGHNPDNWASIEAVIDGCIDSNYVNTGTLTAYGVPDLPHILEVNRANNEKFPHGVATLRADGKFQKPPGWRGPNHLRVKEATLQYARQYGLDSRWGTKDLSDLAQRIINQ